MDFCAIVSVYWHTQKGIIVVVHVEDFLRVGGGESLMLGEHGLKNNLLNEVKCFSHVPRRGSMGLRWSVIPSMRGRC